MRQNQIKRNNRNEHPLWSSQAFTYGDGLLVGVDARQTATGLESRSLKHSELMAALNRSEAKPVVLLDACFSGLVNSNESVAPGLQPLQLAELSGAGRAVVMTAAASDQYAGPLPGSRTARPAFSYLALGALRGWGDKNQDGAISAAEVVAYSGGVMGALVNGREQTPEISGTDTSEALVKSAGEHGPDISEMARKLSAGEDVVFNGDGLVLGSLPQLNLRDIDRSEMSGDIDIGKIDLEREKMLEEKYIRLQEAKQQVEVARRAADNDITGLKQMSAWCQLAEMEDPNPYRKEAAKACSQATSYVEQRRRLVVAMDADWETVKGFMQLQHRSIDDKRKVVEALLEAYGFLTEQTPIQAAVLASKYLARGELPPMESIEDPETLAQAKEAEAKREQQERDEAAQRLAEEKTAFEASGETQRKWGVGLIGTGVSLAGLGVIFAGITKWRYDELKSTCGNTGPGCSSDDRTVVHALGLLADWSFGISAATLLTGIIVRATVPRWKENEHELELSLAPTPKGKGATLGLGGTF